MKNAFTVVLALAALALAGCKDKPKEVPRASRAQAAQNVSEAEFALQIRDYTRAENLLANAVKLDPGVSQYWLQLGATRKRLGNNGGAREAYEEARDLVRAQYRREKAGGTLLVEIEICLLLGKPEEARKLLERAQRDHKDDPAVRQFIEQDVLNRMMNNPELKAVGL